MSSDRRHDGRVRRRGAGAARRAARAIAPALALVAVLGGCSAAAPSATPPATPPAVTPTTTPATPDIGSAVSAPATEPPATTPAPTTAAAEAALGPEEQRVAGALRTYLGAVAVGDFATACAQLTVESAEAVVVAVRGAGGAPVGCPDALAAVLLQPGAAQTAIDAASTTAVQQVTLDGLNATVRWTSTQRGVTRTDAVAMQSVDGQWRLAGPA